MAKRKSIRSFNLNALPVLREILVQGSVSKAAKELSVSQPALSATLKQLRHHFDDELLERTPSGMKLTKKAQALSLDLEYALDALEKVVRGPEKIENRIPFTIATTDHIINRFAVPLMQKLEAESNPIRPNFVVSGIHSAEQLASGSIDMVITPRSTMLSAGAQSKLLSEVGTETLCEEDFVAIGPASDPRLRIPMSVDEYLAYPHASFSLDPNSLYTAERAHLATNNLVQNDIIQVATSTLLPDLVVALNCISLVPRKMATNAAARLPIHIFKPPIDFPKWDWVAIWHNRLKDSEVCRSVLEAFRIVILDH